MPRAVTARDASLIAMLATIASCTYPPTRVPVVVDTDFAPGRTLRLTATMRRASSGEGAVRTWSRDPSGMLDGGAPIAVPASFAIVPAEGEPRDDAIDLLIEARLAPGSGGEPEAVTRRHARFRFTPRQPTFVRVFLSSVCAAQASGCTSATGPAHLGSNVVGLLPMDRMTSIGAGPSMRLGATMAGDGDIDGDGSGDFVAADPVSDRVSIFRGGGMDGVTTPAWADFGPPAGGSGGFGGDLGGGGDVDRDGYDDFVVVTGGQSNSQSYLFRGGSTAPTVPAVTFTPLMAGDSIASVGM